MTGIEMLSLIIQSEIFGKPTESEIESKLSVKTVEDMLSLAESHDLSHIAASYLSKHDIVDGGEELNKILMLALYRDGQREYALAQVKALFEREKIVFIPLKGAVSCKYYPEAWMRTSCDIDVLIHKKDSDRAISLLCSEGFNREYDKTTHDYSLFSPNGVHLELHYKLNSNGYIAKTDKLLSEVWSYATPVSDGKYQYELTNEMFMLYHIAHMAKHFVHGGCGIKPFIDMEVLKEKMPMDDEVLVSLLEKAGLLNFFRAAEKLSAVWFGEEIHTGLTAKMEEFILTGGVYGTVDSFSAMRVAKGESKLDRFLKIIFLPRANLQVLYPKLKKHPKLLCIYQVRRWFGIFKREKRKNIKSTVTEKINAAEKDVSSAAELLKHLEII